MDLDLDLDLDLGEIEKLIYNWGGGFCCADNTTSRSWLIASRKYCSTTRDHTKRKKMHK